MPRDIEMMVARVLSLCPSAIMSFPWALRASVQIPIAIHPSSEQRVLVSQLLSRMLPRTESWAAVPSLRVNIGNELHCHFSEIMNSSTA